MPIRKFVERVLGGGGRPEPSPPTEPTYSEIDPDVPDVVRWVPVSLRWLGHRAEPLASQRLGGYDAPLDDEILARQEHWAEAGYDGAGRPIARREVSRHGGPEMAEVAVRGADGTIRIELEDGGVVRTFFDPSGRAVRTTYEGFDDDPSEEIYVYDEAGRLIAIDESPEIGFTTMHSIERYNMGGRVEIVHDDVGLAKIVARDRTLVWERADRPRGDLIAELVDAMEERCMAALAEAVADAKLEGPPEAYGLAVSYTPQGALGLTVSIGLEEDRLAAGGGEDGAISTLYLGGCLTGIEIPFEEPVGAAMSREIALVQPEDPYRAAAEALARRLSGSQLPGIAKSPAFVAWAADFDEGLAPKAISIQQCNAPDQLKRWKAGWGGQVLPYTDDAPGGAASLEG